MSDGSVATAESRRTDGLMPPVFLLRCGRKFAGKTNWTGCIGDGWASKLLVLLISGMFLVNAFAVSGKHRLGVNVWIIAARSDGQLVAGTACIGTGAAALAFDRSLACH